jgi:hypothetical protein
MDHRHDPEFDYLLSCYSITSYHIKNSIQLREYLYLTGTYRFAIILASLGYNTGILIVN